MKNLPATIGLIAILTLFVFFKGDPDHALQAAPVSNSNVELSLQQDTFPPKPTDTTMKHHKKKDWKKKKDSTWREKRDSV